MLGASAVAARAADDSFFTDLGKSDEVSASSPDKPAPADGSTAAGKTAAAGSQHAVAIDAPGWAMDATDVGVLPISADWNPGHAATTVARTGGADPEPDAPAKPATDIPARDPLDGSAGTAAVTPVAPEPLPPLNAAVKAALDKQDAAALHGPDASEQRKERSAVAFFYAARNFSPLWSADGKPTAAVASLIARLAHAGEDALKLANTPTALVAQGAPDAVAESDIGLTRAVVAYARQASGSRVDPRSIGPLIGYRPALADPGEILDELAGAGAQAGDRLRALNPVDPRYIALRDKLDGLRKGRLPSSEAAAVPPGPTLHVGMHDKRVPALRARLGLALGLGDDDERRYDPELADAVASFQREHDLPPSGALTRRTVAALAGEPKSSRLEGTLVANMEMWRWMPRNLAADRIEVNVPDFLVTVFHADQQVAQHRVVVGKPDTPTPLFANTMKYLIVNPYWNVPQSIIKNELLPKGGGSLNYLQSRGYSVSWRGGVATVKQLPGDKNALGRIKFLFPNDYSVYLHDTPSKPLFAATQRAFSHGCVRVDQPFGFAEAVLNDASPDSEHKRWTAERLEDMIGDKERYVNLPAPLPIDIEYFTATVEDGGRVKTRADIYGYIHAIAAALGEDSDPAPKVNHDGAKALVAERTHHRAMAADADVDPEPEVVRERPRPAWPERTRRRTAAAVDETTTASMPPPAAAPRGFWDSIFSPQ